MIRSTSLTLFFLLALLAGMPFADLSADGSKKKEEPKKEPAKKKDEPKKEPAKKKDEPKKEESKKERVKKKEEPKKEPAKKHELEPKKEPVKKAGAGVAKEPVLFKPGLAKDWHMVYTPSHRAVFEQEWSYTFSNYSSSRWFIALRYPPDLAWSRKARGKAELLTSAGWKPFKEVREGSAERRRMLVIDDARVEPKLSGGFTVRTTLEAHLHNQYLVPGKAHEPIKLLSKGERAAYLQATHTYDFHNPIVKGWMDHHKMWREKDEPPIDFVFRVYKELRRTLPYDTKDGGEWIASQILKVGYGECCRHSIVGTAILRANKIPSRTVCSLWAVDNSSQGTHCWGEFFTDGAGWVPFDTTFGAENPDSAAYFGNKDGQLLAGMVDFDWVINAGALGKHTVFGIDAFPGYWTQGTGSTDSPGLNTKTSVHVSKP